MSTNFVFFFFSSRRRHTRLQGDWSSDVCSSDLHLLAGKTPPDTWHTRRETGPHRHGSGTAPDGRTAEGGHTRPRESGLPRTEATHAFRNGFECSPRSRSPPWRTGHRRAAPRHADGRALRAAAVHYGVSIRGLDRKSTRLNSSHLVISYAVFCLKK